jgi:hypothetical protein
MLHRLFVCEAKAMEISILSPRTFFETGCVTTSCLDFSASIVILVQLGENKLVHTS